MQSRDNLNWRPDSADFVPRCCVGVERRHKCKAASRITADDARDRFEIAKTMKSNRERSVDQARKPFEKRIASGQDDADTLSARTSVMRLHCEYVQARMPAVSEQAGEMRQIMHRKAINATKQKA